LREDGIAASADFALEVDEVEFQARRLGVLLG